MTSAFEVQILHESWILKALYRMWCLFLQLLKCQAGLQNILVQELVQPRAPSNLCAFIRVLRELLVVWCCHLGEFLDKMLMKDPRSHLCLCQGGIHCPSVALAWSLAGLYSLEVWGLARTGTLPCLLHGNVSFGHKFHSWHFQNLLLH